MKKISFLLFCILCFFSAYAQEIFHREMKLMGSRYDLYVVTKNADSGNYYIDMAAGEISRIEKLISSWDSHSETSKINRNAGIRAVEVSEELFQLIQRALTISKLTDGAFDITYASMDKIWKFDGSMRAMPSPEEVQKAVSRVGYKNIVLNEEKRSVFLPVKGMKIGFGAIGKGYSADQAKNLLISKGVKAGIINASGDMTTWGHQPDGKEWTIAITNPLYKEEVFAVLPVSDKAVVTSGDYEKFVEFDNTKYSHIIDPRSGYPAKGIISVSIIAPSAELADALATSVFVMGTETGIDRINQLPDVECIIIDEKGKIYTSKHINIDQYEK